MRSREDELAGCPPLLRTLVAAYDFEGDGILDAIPFRFIHEPGKQAPKPFLPPFPPMVEYP